MPNLKASIKDLKQAKSRTIYNNRIRNRMKESIKKFNTAVSAGDLKTAQEKYPRVQEMLDKAAKHGIIKKGSASRHKSSLAKKLNALAAPDVDTTS